ncbi:MCP four helix bundle domain-containing protein [Flavobacterium caeni]|uniref:Four helix bundle sensory module for signal transduction n=1 Tax=Flavobacterium caeni TaxID=490189 RepID=A0A1G5DZ44_9FLAO|nr:hypothetical protein [Flavobacterium caeni]SCY20012.1 hypothetical protein SAMN02927903_00888 [Flavobacterium caeni]
MKWAYGIKNKLMASAVLLGLCLLVLLNNYLERTHAQNVKDAISTLYEDRLIADDYILKMTRNVYRIRETLTGNPNPVSKSESVQTQLADFHQTYGVYRKTKLTPKELSTAMALIDCVRDFEKALPKNDNTAAVYTDHALRRLDELAQIQLVESKSIMKHVESQYANIKASSQFAFAIIILILIVLQIIVFSSASLIPKVRPKDPRLN